MKIGILTQPLHNNYGGLLQAFALQTYLKKLGCDPWVVRRVSGDPIFIMLIYRYFKYLIFKYILKKKFKGSPFKNKLSQKEIHYISKNTSYFIEKYINPKTELIDNTKALKKISKEGYDAYIVGSDQVWRFGYSPNILNYYLNFLVSDRNVIRLSYAASFGLSNWHYPFYITPFVSYFAKRFKSISVREDDGIELCEKYLGVEAQHHIDPTLLLSCDEYIKLVENENESKSEGNLLTYILDDSCEKQKFIRTVSKNKELIPFTVMPNKKITLNNRSEIEDGIYPSVTKWLRGFMDAKYVITDSFHGCVFSILFNVPFIAIGNPLRGMSRFLSLLRMFNLENRLLYDLNNFDFSKIDVPINWDDVNAILKDQRNKSNRYLIENLNLDK
ncbi:polysaccharide pyruvyl transferase [Bacteroidales bacterium 6E]|nr:polysaccharide pyruvyl transferase [Bacteroidales bacterium 6E]